MEYLNVHYVILVCKIANNAQAGLYVQNVKIKNTLNQIKVGVLIIVAAIPMVKFFLFFDLYNHNKKCISSWIFMGKLDLR